MLTLSSPAKINLFLQVVNRRPDQYHNLASLFQTISLSDQIEMVLANKDKLECSDPSLPTDSTNLVWKAVDLFRRKTARLCRVRIRLQKNIPSQAGLGGGSSNAATVIWGLNALCGSNIPEAILARWSGEIGSDVPFFFSQGTAYCTGRGEIVQPVDFVNNDSVWIVKPTEGSSTPEVFSKVQLDLLPQRDPLDALQACIAGKMEYFNDLEQSAFSALPKLAQLKEELLGNGFHKVVMTGSGSSFVCYGAPLRPLPPSLFSLKVSFIQRVAGKWY